MNSFKSSSSSKQKESEETKKCPECLADIPKEAKKCSHCGTKQKRHLTTIEIIGIFAVPLFIIVTIANIGGSSSSESSSSQAQKVTETQTHIMAQSFVEDILKSPASADFPTSDYSSIDLGDNKFKVVSYVDSQNSFGATIRSNWSVTLTHNGGDWSKQSNWTLHELIFDGELVYSDIEQ